MVCHVGLKRQLRPCLRKEVTELQNRFLFAHIVLSFNPAFFPPAGFFFFFFGFAFSFGSHALCDVVERPLEVWLLAVSSTSTDRIT